MSNNLYEEAINAAEQIKEATENKVKQQLIAAMSPKIKSLIQERYMESDVDECGEGEVKELDEMDELDEDVEECGEGDLKEDVEECGEGEVKEIEVSNESIDILKKLISKGQKRKAVNEKLESIREGINSLKKAMILAESSNKTNKFKSKFNFAYTNLLQELKNIKSSSIIKTDKTLLKEFLQLSKELNNMSRRRSRSRYLNENLEELLEMNLFEEDRDEDSMDDDVDEMLADEDSDDDMPDMSDDSDAGFDDLMSEPLEKVLQAALDGMGGEDSPVDIDMDDEDEGVEEGYVYEVDEMESEMAELEEYASMLEADDDDDKKEVEEEGLDEGLFLEIDENMLKREIKNMRRLREGDASDMASHFGGGSLDREMFVDSDEGDLNVHAGHLGREDVPTPKVEAALRNVVRKNRIAESKNKQYRNALRGMKKQLSEMNLFNAKLLYANKLMQNRDLSIKQQKHIVESLDEAGTLNEAKLLFESLSKSLSRPTRKGGNLNESANRRVLSSSSRSVRSAQPMNEGVALDRWATLAGIKK
tara:strand:+ start:796 stop:2397 length:1602 start_codon:yes stop_codon:yes gene_type:complete